MNRGPTGGQSGATNPHGPGPIYVTVTGVPLNVHQLADSTL